MPTGPRLLLPNVCYHIIMRGNQRQKVFFDNQDYKKYLLILRKYKKKHGFLLYGFCLMPNHIHLVGEPKQPTNMGRFMQVLSRSYTGYFNKRYNKVGHLWQGRFKSKVIVKDNYFIDCIHYIELNPVRANLVKAAYEYCWSSHRERALEENNGLAVVDKMHL